jgi:hypothetical protein
MHVAPPSERTTRVLRIAMLVVIALVALANAAGLDDADADLWIPFVCIIAVMGVGTRGGPVNSLGFVLIEASVVALLGVATFSGSRDGVWVASVAISVLAIGKIAVVEMHRLDASKGGASTPATMRSGEHTLPPLQRADEDDSPREDRANVSTGSGSARLSETGASAAPQQTGLRTKEASATDERPAVPRTISELPPAPMMNPAPQQNVAPIAAKEIEPPRKKRDRNDPTPRAVPIRRP